MFTTLSTILVPINTGFTSSPFIEWPLLIASTENPLLGTLPFCLVLPVEDDRTLGGPGLDLEAEDGLSGKVFFRFGGVSFEKPGISQDFEGLDFMMGELPRKGPGFFTTLGPGFVTEEDLVGVEDLDMGLEVGVEGLLGFTVAGNEDREVGVEGLWGFVVEGSEAREVGVEGREGFTAVGSEAHEVGVEGLLGFVDEGTLAREVGVDDLAGFVVAGSMGLEVGVEGLEGFLFAGNVARPVGVAGLEAVGLDPPDDDGLPFEDTEGLTVSLFLFATCVCGLACIDSEAVVWPFEMTI